MRNFISKNYMNIRNNSQIYLLILLVITFLNKKNIIFLNECLNLEEMVCQYFQHLNPQSR
jgi:hypothetical protein